jgi:hypothetical protein
VVRLTKRGRRLVRALDGGSFRATVVTVVRTEDGTERLKRKVTVRV